MPSSPSLPSAAELVGSISYEKELQIESDIIKRSNCLAILHILLPAALRSAASGNPEMLAAVEKAWPYIKSL